MRYNKWLIGTYAFMLSLLIENKCQGQEKLLISRMCGKLY